MCLALFNAYECKNVQPNVSKRNPTIHKKDHYNRIKLDSLQSCKDGLTYVDQSMWYTTLIKEKTKTVWLSQCLLSYSVESDSCDPMDCNPPGSSVHGISQARMLEWVAIPFSRGSSQPRDWTHVSCVSCISRQIILPLSHLGSHLLQRIFPTQGSNPRVLQILNHWATREAHLWS